MVSTNEVAAGKRLKSLDFFRGATVAAMILVNNPGSWSHIYGPLEHAAWHGWTPTDLIFPFFLFIVGVSIVLAFTKARAKGAENHDLMKKTLIRAAKIFGLGLVLATFPFIKFNPEFGLYKALADVRIPGVLQRIALCYAIGAALFLYTRPKTQILTLGGLLISYWLMMMFIPVPGVGAGAINAPETNLAAYIDKLILGSHMWKENWDPEGLLSTLPAIGTTLIGIWTGRILMAKDRSETQKTLDFFIQGFILLILGYLWSWIFPINKNIWTSSYTLFTGGQAMMIFGLCYWFIDVKERHKYTNWAIAFGMNAITVFFLSGIIGRLMYLIKFTVSGETYTPKGYLYEVIYGSFASPINASLLYAITWILGFYLLARWMQKKGIIIKV